MASPHRSYERLQKALVELRDAMLAAEKRAASHLRKVAPEHRKSALNLVHYIALRGFDLRAVQLRLAQTGLSSLGRSEAHALEAVDRLLGLLGKLSGTNLKEATHIAPADMTEGSELLREHTASLLGDPRRGQSTRVMVTMPSEAASDYALVRNLVAAGMDCMRINCAHDDDASWIAMASNLKRARRELGRDCKILMDLPGPKIRTGVFEADPPVKKVKPQRDELGRVSKAARVWLTSRLDQVRQADATFIVDAAWLSGIRSGTALRLRDTRGRERKWRVTAVNPRGVEVELTHTSYVTNGTLLSKPKSGGEFPAHTRISGIEEKEGGIDLKVGDTLLLTLTRLEGRAARYAEDGRLLHEAHVACIPPHAVSTARVGDRVSFDDGKLAGKVSAVRKREIRVEITHTQPGGSRLKAGKAINLPDCRLAESALTRQDRDLLKLVVKHADLVGLSFVNSARDVGRLIKQLRQFRKRLPGIVLKIETGRGFEQLPAILLAAMEHPRYGVMVARGDLAIELGYERLAEAQEEILWLCEAAHCPSIWATQVLESLAKKGTPSRAEVTDAAMSHRAECVMLNKGPYVLEAVRLLANILKRMSAHQSKKRSMMRALRIARQFRG